MCFKLYAHVIHLSFSYSEAGSGIDCFKCVSVNGSNPACEDPFHNNYSISLLERPCMGGRKSRNGLFPASACIKVVGKYCMCYKNMENEYIGECCFYGVNFEISQTDYNYMLC